MGKPNQLMLVERLVRAGIITGTIFTASRYIPKQLKWFTVFLVALNLRMFPTWWHGEFFLHIVHHRSLVTLLLLSIILSSAPIPIST